MENNKKDVIKPLTVMSLFDGIACGRVALERAGIPVNKYYASEIDKYAIAVAQKNHPDIIQLGDINNWEKWNIDWASIDVLIGGSPCFTAGTLVMTSNGFKNIEDIKVGDYVLTHKSRYRKVLRIGNKQVNKIYKIKGMGLHELETTEEHPFYIRERYKKWNNEKRSYDRKFKEPKWEKASNLNSNTFLGSTYNTEIPNKQSFRANDTDFWYFVGRFTADGWIVKTKRKHRINSFLYKVMLCCSHDELEECKNILDKIGYNYYVTKERTVYKFCISNMELLHYLEKINKGALNKIIHPDVWNLPLKSKEAFVEGYISGDGYKEKNGYISATSISKNLIYGLKILINEIYDRPVTIEFTEKKPTHIIENRLVNQHSTYCIRFKKNIGKQDTAFKEEKYTWSPIRKIEIEDKNCTVYNLEVEEDNSYTANTIVVHNCQGFSVAGKHLNFDDPRSKLFFKYVEILNHIKKYNPNVKFLLENVKMKKEYEDGISELLGVEPVSIDSSLLSAQSRKRLYWTNIPNATIPEDKHIMLQDILLENTYTEANKSYCIDACYVKGTLSDYLKRGRRQHVCQILEEYIVPIDKTLVVLEKEVQEGKLGYFRKDSQANRVYYPTQKGITLCGEAGGGCAKMGQYFFGEIIKDFKGLDLSQYVHPCFILKTDKGNDVLLAGYIRKLTPEECERLQTLDDGYTSVIPKTQRYKCLGNGWTVDVVAHILKGLQQEG